MMKIIQRVSILILLLLTCSGGQALAGDRPLVVFANPAYVDDSFFGLMTNFMKAAAEDLGFDLEVYNGDRNHVVIDENVKLIFSREQLPDYIIGMNARESGLTMLDRAEAAGIKTVFVNQSFLGESRKKAGHPGEKYKLWLFEYLPDDVHSGYILAKTLFDAALKKGLVDEAGLLHVIGVNGHAMSGATVLRKQGLMQAVAEYPQVRLLQVVQADWKRDTARKLTKGLIERYPEVSVVWSASDIMGMGVAEGLREMDRTPGVDVLTGGVDWARLAQGLVENGDFTVSVGGHFMDGAWALVMLYDQIHGIPVPKSGLSKFSTITADNVSQYRRYFGNSNWSLIDFKKFSKYENPKIKEYDFNLKAVLDQVEGQ